MFNDWKSWRNVKAATEGNISDHDICPIRVELLNMTKDELCFCLTRFVLEAKKQNGQEYPAETLYEIIISIQLYMSLNGREIKFLNDPEFVVLKNTLDSKMKDLTSQGCRSRRRQAQIISDAEEEKMWELGVLGDDTPQKLLDTVLYFFGIHFALRAGQEHRNLRFQNSQISVETDSEGHRYLLYTEDISKNRQGGLKHRLVKPKSVRAYENNSNPNRCIVRLYLKYLSHRPTDAKCSPAFYLRPLAKPRSNIWFSCQPLGINQISKTVARMCQSANIGGFRSNHSLRATAASRLYDQNVDEQLICETTGHRSSAVRAYKRTNDGHKKRISDTLYGIPSTSTQAAPEPAQVATVSSHRADGRDVSITVNIKLDK
jgi:integrase